MKTIDQDELFRNITQFLQRKGVELKEGSYSRRLQQCCGLLADVVNTTNKTVARACAEVDQKLKDIRETVRRPSGRKPPPQPAPAEPGPVFAPPPRPQAKGRRKPAAKRTAPVASKRVAAPGKRKVARKPKSAG